MLNRSKVYPLTMRIRCGVGRLGSPCNKHGPNRKFGGCVGLTKCSDFSAELLQSQHVHEVIDRHGFKPVSVLAAFQDFL